MGSSNSSQTTDQSGPTETVNPVRASQIAIYKINDYIIPNIDIHPEDSRPFRTIAHNSLRTHWFILEMCPKYMSKEGCNINYCFRFHLCSNWIKNTCELKNCSFEHNFQGKENAILYNKVRSEIFEEEEIKDGLKAKLFLKQVCKEDWSSCICMDFILKQCRRNDCVSYHLNSLYSWQFFYKNSWHHFSFSQNNDIEKSFCDPSKSLLSLNPQPSLSKHSSTAFSDLIFPNQIISVDFRTMCLTNSTKMCCPIKRISTPSDVNVYESVATRWLWYWNDDEANWNFYTNAIVSDFIVLPFSDYIETQFLKKIGEFKFKLNQHDSMYTINFKEMIQTNLKTGMKRVIRRRPMPSQYNDMRWNVDMSFKSLWSNLMPKEGFLRQEVSRTSPEFTFIKKMIIDSMKVREIYIQRIENFFLWEAYQLKKAQMMRAYGNDLQIVSEAYMFHGTCKQVVDRICTENFDWKMHGKRVGSDWGKGTYFANIATVANRYAAPDPDNYKWIFVALVLVGKATVGDSRMIIPPLDPTTNKRFDSTVNDQEKPLAFVKYNMDEYYPAYLVKLKTI